MNVHHHREAMEAHLDGRVHLSVEEGEAARHGRGARPAAAGGSTGGPSLVVNADAWCPGSLDRLRRRAGTASGSASCSQATTRCGPRSRVAGALLPWSAVADARGRAVGPLRGVLARRRRARCSSTSCATTGRSSTAARRSSYLAANLRPSGGANVVGAGAQVDGHIERSVVWPGAVVHPAESLVDAIRFHGCGHRPGAGSLTMELGTFDVVGEAVRALVPAELGPVHQRSHRYGIKVWFGADKPPRAALRGAGGGREARCGGQGAGHRGRVPRGAPAPRGQRRGRRACCSGARRRGARCSATMSRPVRSSGDRRTGGACRRRGPIPDLGDPELAMEVATRLVDYVVAFEPLLRTG